MKSSEIAKAACLRTTKTFKVTPRLEDVGVLADLNVALVKLWNLAIRMIADHAPKKSDSCSADTKKYPPHSYYSLTSWLTRMRDEHPEITKVSVGLSREMLRRLAGSYASYFALKKQSDHTARPPREKEVDKAFIALTWTGDSLKIVQADDRRFALSAPLGKFGSNNAVHSGRTQVQFIPEGDYPKEVLELLTQPGHSLAQVTISKPKKRNGEMWASFVVNTPRPEEQTVNQVMGIDLGAGYIACSCSNGTEFLISTRRGDKYWRENVQALEKRVEKCTKNSRAWRRRMKARRTILNKSGYQHTDHQKKVAHWLAEQGCAVVIGKMRTRLGLARSENGHPDQHWGAQNVGYALRMKTLLGNKLAEKGLVMTELPDPARAGRLEDPSAKFHASRQLLEKACKERGLPFPTKFRTIEVKIPQ